MKTCTKCGVGQPLDKFRADKKRSDGRFPQCKACKSAYDAKRREKRRDKIAASKSIWYHLNREDIRAKQAEHRAANPQLKWEGKYRRRAVEYGFEPKIESFTRDELIARYGDTCYHCGGPFEQLDHAPVPVAHGGEHSLDNCKPSCAPCNRRGAGVRTINKTDIGETA